MRGRKGGGGKGDKERERHKCLVEKNVKVEMRRSERRRKSLNKRRSNNMIREGDLLPLEFA